MRRRLGKLPTELRNIYEETYTQNMESYEDGEKAITEAALRLLCLGVRLSTQDFLLALSCCQDKIIDVSCDELLDLCFNFILQDTETNVFRFAHLSVREFLEAKQGWSEEENHATAAECCLRYLCSTEVVGRYPVIGTEEYLSHNDVMTMDIGDVAVWKKWRLLKTHAADLGDSKNSNQHSYSFGAGYFHRYAALHWPRHLRESKAYLRSTQLQTLCRDFMMDTECHVAHAYTCWSAEFPRCRGLDGYGFGPDSYDLDQLIGRSFPRSKLTRPILEAFGGPDYIVAASVCDLRDILERRIQRDPKVLNKKLEVGFTLLGSACYSGSLPTVQMLIEKGASLAGRSGYKALCCATRGRNLDMMRFLLQQGVSPSHAERVRGEEPDYMSTKYLSETPLHEAVKFDDKEMVRLLLDFGANPHLGRVDGENLLLPIAIKGGRANVVPLLVDSIGNMRSIERSNIVKASRMHRAVRDRDSNDLSLALENWPKNVKADLQLAIALGKAVSKQDVSCARLLLAEGADPNTTHGPSKMPVLVNAATLRTYGNNMKKVKRCNILESLLVHGADPSTLPPLLHHDGSVLCDAVKLGLEAIIELLVDAGVNINALDKSDRSGMTPLHKAVFENRVGIVKYLIAKGAEVNAMVEYVAYYRPYSDLGPGWKPGFTALDLAERSGNHELQQFLIEHGAISGCDCILQSTLDWRESLLN